jgi:hypothetical protein
VYPLPQIDVYKEKKRKEKKRKGNSTAIFADKAILNHYRKIEQITEIQNKLRKWEGFCILTVTVTK